MIIIYYFFFLFRKIVAEYEKTIAQMIGKEKGFLCVGFVFWAWALEATWACQVPQQ